MTTNTLTQTRTTQPQLTLISTDTSTHRHWELDDQTRETGRRGLEKARAALRASRPAFLDEAA